MPYPETLIHPCVQRPSKPITSDPLDRSPNSDTNFPEIKNRFAIIHDQQLQVPGRDQIPMGDGTRHLPRSPAARSEHTTSLGETGVEQNPAESGFDQSHARHLTFASHSVASVERSLNSRLPDCVSILRSKFCEPSSCAAFIL